MIIAVFGKSGSGKSTIAINLAKSIADSGNAVGIISNELRYADISKLFTVNIPENKSLINAILDYENVLNYYTEITNNIYLLSVGTDTNIKNLDIVSDYLKTASKIESDKKNNINSMLNNSLDIFDFLIIDCTDKVDDSLTFISLLNANKIINVIESSVSGISFEIAHKPLKESINFQDKWINVLNKHIESVVNKRTIESTIMEEINYVIPFSKDIFISNLLLSPVNDIKNIISKLKNELCVINNKPKKHWFSFFK